MSKGPVLVYSNYVLMEGFQVFKIYLKYFGFNVLKNTATNTEHPIFQGKDYYRYTEYHGLIDKPIRSVNLEFYNVPENIDGKICKIIMISQAGSAGISLMNCRQVHILEPYWHEILITQMIGRANRQCSHRLLPMKERTVDVYRYKSIRQNKKITTDQYIENVARLKEGLIQSFYNTVKEAAIDCNLFKTHNTLAGDYKCFQFEEQSLLTEYIGPAYKDDIYDDLNNMNGSNSINAKTIRTRVKKIQAVILMNPDTSVYSQPKYYWMNPETGIIYDFELFYVVGKIGFDDSNIPMKLNKDVYIVDKLVPIPLIDEKIMN
jgi:hypothetical protein